MWRVEIDYFTVNLRILWIHFLHFLFAFQGHVGISLEFPRNGARPLYATHVAQMLDFDQECSNVRHSRLTAFVTAKSSVLPIIGFDCVRHWDYDENTRFSHRISHRLFTLFSRCVVHLPALSATSLSRLCVDSVITKIRVEFSLATSLSLSTTPKHKNAFLLSQRIWYALTESFWFSRALNYAKGENERVKYVLCKNCWIS